MDISDDETVTVEINGDGNFVRLVVIQREDKTEAPVISDVLIKGCFEPKGQYDRGFYCKTTLCINIFSIC